jgi:hypothetical protein
MDLPSKKVFEVLQSKGVASIHHANSVITACQFLRIGSLVSRGAIERKKLYQTPQDSDAIDKRWGVWFDVFADSVDIHQRAKRANAYGPVLFVLNAELIKSAYTGRVWVTKLNPTKWEGTNAEDRWFTSIADLNANYVKGRFDQMIVFRHCGGALPFGPHLQRIVLDDPQRKTPGRIDYYSMAYGALTFAIAEGPVAAKIERRNCPAGCACNTHYSSDVAATREMFWPKPV